MDGAGKHSEHGNLELVEMGEWARDILMEKLGSLGNAKGVLAPPPILQSANRVNVPATKGRCFVG